ncbi:retrovirus-related pol polyprotein from transposon TNT 1-94 [Tanacetum coccineum]|uniref:Retrovirus-related pol polyprotein from transposon TNT 1-94 n=1 Tax=Tanacetum coccineum TaxID=301880 RepID=A0ABQ5EXE4_9ASTR
MKNNSVCKENGSNVFRKEREQYHEIQDLKAQMQDKNMVINELKKLILVTKGKSVETQFDKPSVVRQPNAQRIPKPSVLGKPTPFSNSPEMRSFQTKQSVNKTNVSDGLFKQVTQQNLPQNRKQAEIHSNVLKPGMYRIATTTTQNREPQLPHASRNTNPHMSKSSGVIHTTSVSRPQLKCYQVKDKVVPNNSQVKFKKKEVEDHHRISSISKKTKSVTACNDSSNSRTSNVNAVCAECGKCVFNSNHDACVSRYLKDVNARTKKPKVVPISASKPKRKANKSVATPHKKTVASDTTIQKSKSYHKELYENTNQEWKWWIAKRCPSGYKWTQKPLRTKKIWMPKIRKEDVSTSISPTIDIVSRITNIVQLILFIVDSGCTKHMTGNLKLLCNFVEKFLGTVRFGNNQLTPILSYGDLNQGNITIKQVYYVEGLNHNLFLVGQFYDADLEVAFRKSTCFVRDLQGNDLLNGNRRSDLYIISLQETTSSTLICFMAKALPTQAWLWHRRLSHLNFDYITLLSKKYIVTGLPKLKYVKDQLCSSCEMSKAKRSSFKSKAVPSSKGRLNLLHMDLYGPMRVERISKKRMKNEAKTTKPDTEWKRVEKTQSNPSPRLVAETVDHSRCLERHKKHFCEGTVPCDKLLSGVQRKPKLHAMSSAEAEYVAISASCAQVTKAERERWREVSIACGDVILCKDFFLFLVHSKSISSGVLKQCLYLKTICFSWYGNTKLLISAAQSDAPWCGVVTGSQRSRNWTAKSSAKTSTGRYPASCTQVNVDDEQNSLRIMASTTTKYIVIATLSQP